MLNDLAEAMKALDGKKIHWRDPVALSVGQPGAPVSSKDCAHGSNVLLRSRWHPGGPLGGWVEAYSGFRAVAATMQCTAGTVLRRRSSGSTWTVLQDIFQLGALWPCTLKILPAAGHAIDHRSCWPTFMAGLHVPDLHCIQVISWLSSLPVNSRHGL